MARTKHQKRGNKNRNKFKPNAGGAKRKLTLEPGLKGFFCTCNFREKDCVKEAYNILNEYADKIYGKEPGREDGNDQNDDDSMEEDVDDALAREVNSLQEERAVTPLKRRFQNVFAGANNCIFINTTLEDPLKIAMAIIKDIDETKQQKTRSLMRLLPVEVICKAWPNDINEACESLFDKYFLGEPTTFLIYVERRNNNEVKREVITEELAGLVKKRNPLHQAKMKNPEMVVFVNVIQNLCLLSVFPKYFYYRKYNLMEIAKPDRAPAGECPETSVDGENNECEGKAGIKVEPSSAANDDSPCAVKGDSPSSTTVDSTSIAKDNSADRNVQPNGDVPIDVKTE